MLSKKLRIKFGLPPTGPLMLSEDQLARLKMIETKYSKRKGSAGLRLERIFLKAWKHLNSYANLVKEVRRATPHEDLLEMTDAVMTMRSGRVVKIQITTEMTNRTSYEQEFMRHGREKIALVEIRPDDLPKTIRDKTISAISRFLLEY